MKNKSYSEKFIICQNCHRYCLWDEIQCNCCGEPIPDENNRNAEDIKEQLVYECPHCDGDKKVINDNDPNGAVTCYYCDGKGWVTYDEAEAYHDHDPNLM